MLAIKPVAQAVCVFKVLQSPISVILHSSCEYNQLIVLTKLLEEFICSWSDSKLPFKVTRLKVM